MKKIALIHNGCAKNLVDSELMLGKLSQAGYNITLDDKEADIVIVNTCSFIHDAEKESVSAVFNMINAGKKVIIAGCLPQKYKKELQELIPEACAFLGTSDIDKIAGIVKNIEKGAADIFEVCETPECSYPEKIERQQITMGASSYIKIADGCDFECGYCIIPKLRGKYKSRTMENIVKEAESLAKKGVSEIILIAQDTSSWGKDIYGAPKLPELLEELNKIEGINWIRIMYAYPSLITDKLLKTMAELDKIVKYIDIPLQHTSAHQLQLMRRPVMDYKKLIEKIRKIIPDCAVRTTFITGYPGETEEDFNELYDFVKTMKLDRIGVFEFSREKNTYAYSLKPQISARVKKERRKKLMELQKSVSKEINEKLKGRKIKCIAEMILPDGAIAGRTYKDAPEIDGMIYIKTDKDITPGDIIEAEVTGADNYDLTGVY